MNKRETLEQIDQRQHDNLRMLAEVSQVRQLLPDAIGDGRAPFGLWPRLRLRLRVKWI